MNIIQYIIYLIHKYAYKMYMFFNVKIMHENVLDKNLAKMRFKKNIRHIERQRKKT